jgi:hypothetical protein
MPERALNPPLALDHLAIRADTPALVDDRGQVLISDEFVPDLVTTIAGPPTDFTDPVDQC